MMIKKILYSALIICISSNLAIGSTIDSLQNVYRNLTEPIEKGNAAIALIEKYAGKNMDSAYYYANTALVLADDELTKNPESKPANGLKGTALFNLAVLSHQTSVYDQAKDYYLKATRYLEKGNKKKVLLCIPFFECSNLSGSSAMPRRWS